MRRTELCVGGTNVAIDLEKTRRYFLVYTLSVKTLSTKIIRRI